MQIKNKNKPKNKEKDCASMENFIQLDWICVKIEKKKTEFQGVVESKFTKLELTNTIPVQPVELNTFNDVDMTPR